MQNNRERISVPWKPLLAGFHILVSLSGWIQFGMALGHGDPRVAYLALAVGYYGLALAGATITANAPHEGRDCRKGDTPCQD